MNHFSHLFSNPGIFFFASFVVVLWIVCFSFRMRAGRRSSRAVRELEDYSDRMLARNRRIDALNGIFREVVRGQRRLDTQKLKGYLQEYAGYANRYQQEQERWYTLLEEARNRLESLRISQNMLGGRDDLAAIPYYTRSGRYNELVHQYNLYREANFDVEVVKQVGRLVTGASQTV